MNVVVQHHGQDLGHVTANASTVLIHKTLRPGIANETDAVIMIGSMKTNESIRRRKTLRDHLQQTIPLTDAVVERERRETNTALPVLIATQVGSTDTDDIVPAPPEVMVTLETTPKISPLKLVAVAKAAETVIARENVTETATASVTRTASVPDGIDQLQPVAAVEAGATIVIWRLQLTIKVSRSKVVKASLSLHLLVLAKTVVHATVIIVIVVPAFNPLPRYPQSQLSTLTPKKGKQESRNEWPRNNKDANPQLWVRDPEMLPMTGGVKKKEISILQLAREQRGIKAGRAERLVTSTKMMMRAGLLGLKGKERLGDGNEIKACVKGDKRHISLQRY